MRGARLLRAPLRGYLLSQPPGAGA